MSRHFIAQKSVAKFRHSYDATNVTTGAWVELFPALAQPASAVEIFDSSGRILKLAFATSGQEDANEYPYYIIPGGSSIFLPVDMFKGARLAIKAVDADATTGDLVMNFFG